MATLTPKLGLLKPVPNVETDWAFRLNETIDILDESVLASGLAGGGITTISDDGAGNITITSVPSALIGSDGITVSSGSPSDTISGFRTEFVSASGSLQTQIDSGGGGSDGNDVSNALIGADGITVTSGSSTDTLTGFRTEFVSASGSLQTSIDAIDSSVTLQEAYDNGTGQITTVLGKPVEVVGSGVYTDDLDIQGALTLAPGSVTVPSLKFSNDDDTGISSGAPGTFSFGSSGVSVLTINPALGVIFGDRLIASHVGTKTEATYSFFPDFDTGMYSPGANQLSFTAGGSDVLRMQSGFVGFEITLSGVSPIQSYDLTTKSYVDVEVVTVSGHLQDEIDGVVDNNDVSNALVGSDGITVTSGSSADTISGFRTEFVNASGTLSSEIDSDISTHAAISNAHHTKYTDAEAISALEPTTSDLAASGVATDANIVSVSGHLQSQISEFDKHVVIENPGGTEDVQFFFTKSSITLTNIKGTIIGTSNPGITWTLRYAATRSDTGTEVVTAGTNTHSANNGQEIISLDSPVITGSSYIWLETTSVSGTVTELGVSIFG